MAQRNDGSDHVMAPGGDSRAAPHQQRASLAAGQDRAPVTRLGPFHRLLIVAVLVIIFAGMKMAATVIVTVLLAATIVVTIWPVARFLSRRTWRPPVRIAIAVVVLLAILGAVGLIVIQGVSAVQQTIAQQGSNVQAAKQEMIRWLRTHHMGGATHLVREFRFFPDDDGWITTGLVGAANFTMQFGLVLLIAFFILLETSVFPHKLRALFPYLKRAGGATVTQVLQQIQRYLLLKTTFSAATGLLVGGWTALWQLESPILWGLLAFVLNFIPFVGSLIAAIPAIGIAYVAQGSEVALYVALGYLVLNVAIGNIIEPRIVGAHLGLSPVIVLVAMVFWGWLLGPVGVVLSAPLTIAIKIGCRFSPQLHWVAIFLSASTEEPVATGAQTPQNTVADETSDLAAEWAQSPPEG